MENTKLELNNNANAQQKLIILDYNSDKFLEHFRMLTDLLENGWRITSQICAAGKGIYSTKNHIVFSYILEYA